MVIAPVQLAASLPLGDWQFWAVTIVMLAAAGYLARPLWRKLRGVKGKRTSATLTIGGEPVSKRKTD